MPGHDRDPGNEANVDPDRTPSRWRPETPHERGVSQQPVPPPEGPLVANVTLHDTTATDASDPVGHGGLWVAVAMLVVIVILLAILWAFGGRLAR